MSFCVTVSFQGTLSCIILHTICRDEGGGAKGPERKKRKNKNNTITCCVCNDDVGVYFIGASGVYCCDGFSDEQSIGVPLPNNSILDGLALNTDNASLDGLNTDASSLGWETRAHRTTPLATIEQLEIKWADMVRIIKQRAEQEEYNGRIQILREYMRLENDSW